MAQPVPGNAQRRSRLYTAPMCNAVPGLSKNLHCIYLRTLGCSTQIKAHRRYPLDLPSKNEVQIKEALRRICDGDTYRAVASSHFQSMVQTYALEAYKINKTGDLQIRWTQVQEYLFQHPWECPNDTCPKTSTWWNVKKERKV